MKLQKRKHKLNYGAEGLPPLRRFVAFVEKKLSFIIYYAIIITVLFFIVTSGWRRFAFHNGNGIITKSQVRVRADRDLHISSIDVKEGDTIEVGDTLCSWLGAHSRYYRRSGVGNRSLDKKLVTLKVSLNEKRAQLREIRGEGAELQKRLESSKKQVALELKPDEKIVTLENLITKNSRKERRLIEEIEGIKVSLLELENLLQTKSDTSTVLFDTLIDMGSFASKWHGEVHSIGVSDGEYIKDGEELMLITRCTAVHIAAFFKMKDYKVVKEGKTVDIVLPNNEIIEGEIVKVFNASESLPAEFKKSYDISRPRIYAHVQPLDSIPCTLYDGMTVRILLKRELPWK